MLQIFACINLYRCSVCTVYNNRALPATILLIVGDTFICHNFHTQLLGGSWISKKAIRFQCWNRIPAFPCSELEGMTRCQITQCSSMLMHRSGLFALPRRDLAQIFLEELLGKMCPSISCWYAAGNVKGWLGKVFLQNPFTNTRP